MKVARRAVAVLLLSAGLAASVAEAQVIITSNTTIAPSDPAYQNQDIVVRGCTVTINGAQSFTSLTIERNESNIPGVVTHDATFSAAGVNGMFLTIAGDLTIQGGTGDLAPSRIDVNAKGFPRGQGPGSSGVAPDEGSAQFPGGQGGSYGGAGGVGWPVAGQAYLTERFVPGPCYGSYSQPSDLGSGSAIVMAGNPLHPTPTGGSGAGAVHLAIGNNAIVDGVISANGQDELAGGSGGSIWISASTLSGSGAITAHGGTANYGAGGGGGRIALDLGTNAFAGTLLACGGNEPAGGPHCYGGEGSVFLRVAGHNDTLIFDNSLIARPTGAADLQGVVTFNADVIVRNKARLEARRGAALNLTINGSLTVDATSYVGAFGRSPRVVNPGDGGRASDFPMAGGGGGGHGGAGGAGYGGPTPQGFGAGGAIHGDPNTPTTYGGNGGANNTGPGWRGGGGVRLTVSGPITLHGFISVDGQPIPDMQGAEGFGAGGAGGGLWITAPTISGAGLITANGGSVSSSSTFGGGGGGRIRIDTCVLGVPASNIQVNGGLGSGGGSPGAPGQPGTIVLTTVPTPPAITLQPAGQKFLEGSTVTLTVGANPEPLTYQWRKDNTPLSDDAVFSGVNTPTLTITGASCAETAGTFDVLVTTDSGCGAGARLSDPAVLRPVADWTGSEGVVNSTDVSIFINDWFDDQERGRTVCDINGDGESNSTDVSDFINNWFAALANGC